MEKKKMSIHWVAVLFGLGIIAALVIICDSPSYPEETGFAISSDWLERQTDIRQKVWSEWLEASRWVAGDDQEAKSVVEFMETLPLAVPGNPGSFEEPAFWPGTLHSKNGLGVLVFTQEDSNNPSWEEEFQDTTMASFECPLILIRPHHRSGKLTKGLVMLQQGYLAMHHDEMLDRNSFYLIQVKCLEMLSRVISQKFPDYTEKVVKRQILLFEISSRPQFNTAGLEAVYGKRAWHSERMYQKGLLTLHTILEEVRRETYDGNYKAMMVRLSIFCEDYGDSGEDVGTAITMLRIAAQSNR